MINEVGGESHYRTFFETSCNCCSDFKKMEKKGSFRWFQICPDIVLLQLTGLNGIIRYTLGHWSIISHLFSLNN